jgi:hypothetical protein
VALEKRGLESVVRNENHIDDGITTTPTKCRFSMQENGRHTASSFESRYTRLTIFLGPQKWTLLQKF